MFVSAVLISIIVSVIVVIDVCVSVLVVLGKPNVIVLYLNKGFIMIQPK